MGRITATLKKLIYAGIPAGYKEFIRQEMLNEHSYYKYLRTGFSQEGEDQILAQYFYGLDTGFYLDIGAYHPINYSNTYKFYLQGWRGINLDAMPGSMAAFNEVRPRDINVETGLAERESTATYHIFSQTGINTFSEEFAAEMVAKGYTLVQKKVVKMRTLQSVLAEFLPANQSIDFLSLDVEGFELDVLRSNDWSLYRPRLIVVESLQLKNKAALDTYLGQVNYERVANTVNNLYYADKG
ncbi:hypothetical protein GCM10027341_54800 [Spirosoma knui]